MNTKPTSKSTATPLPPHTPHTSTSCPAPQHVPWPDSARTPSAQQLPWASNRPEAQHAPAASSAPTGQLAGISHSCPLVPFWQWQPVRVQVPEPEQGVKFLPRPGKEHMAAAGWWKQGVDVGGWGTPVAAHTALSTVRGDAAVVVVVVVELLVVEVVGGSWTQLTVRVV